MLLKSFIRVHKPIPVLEMARETQVTAPDSGIAILGRTLTEMFYDACENRPNEKALNQPRGQEWDTWSLDRFRTEAEEIALGLLESGLDAGDRVALFMQSDVYFCLVDMGCLLAQLVDVPIYLTHKDDQIHYVLQHSESAALVLSDEADLARIQRLGGDLSSLKLIVIVNGSAAGRQVEGREVISLDELRSRGRDRKAHAPREISDLRQRIKPDDLATIIYTSGTTGMPKGVMLSHENISFNALTSFSVLPDFRRGAEGEIALSFLPLTHIFARTLHYGFLESGATVYFSDPDTLSADLQRVRPTVFASVPRLIERVYARILERLDDLSGFQKGVLTWALELGGEYEIGRDPSPWWKVQRVVADALVFKKWRQALGGRSKYIIAGGAALNGDLANLFAAAGVTVLQGYGLTETSPVITYNRPPYNRAGTVGVPIPGVEVTLAEDGEILTRGPHIMMGYYRDPERTNEIIDADGWLHTGDVGEITPDGFLKITDRKKDLFKLSTGKYVTPQPLESRLTSDPLVEQAFVIGSEQKYCVALIFPDHDALEGMAEAAGKRDVALEELIKEAAVTERYKRIVEAANQDVDQWSEIKRFALIPSQLSVERGLLTPTMKIRRPQIRSEYEDVIRALYEEEIGDEREAEFAIIDMGSKHN